LNFQGQFSCASHALIHTRKVVWALAALAIALVAFAASPAASHGPRQTSNSHHKTAEPSRPPVKAYGSPSAPITMEVFTDYECPACRSLYEQTLKLLINDYVASGKVYLVHHDFPLSMHKYSGQAARWANAAAEVGEFDKVEAALYDNQNSWQNDGSMEKYISAAMSAADFKRVQLHMRGCDPPGPTAGTPSPHPCPLDAYIETDIALGEKVPVKSTPTYAITYKGQRLPPGSGVVSWPILKQFFDSLLGQ